MLELYPYQKDGVDKISKNYSYGIRRQLFQLPTGGGKTICFSGMIHRYMQAFSKNVLVMVHRDELLKQSQETLYNDFKIRSHRVDRKVKKKVQSKVTVAMVDTAKNRLKKDRYFFGDVGLLIVDECHIGNFKKIYDYFPGALIVGFSATPISATIRDPLLNYYDEIVTGPQISELIEFGSLTPNQTYSLKGIDRGKLKVRAGKYEDKAMGEAYSKSKNVHNTVEAYRKLGDNEKTIIFNVNVEHSKLVNDAFVKAGYPSMHLDGSSSRRKQIMKWFHDTPNAILNNIGVLTTGFDEPTVKNVIINKSTLSKALWLQMTGRGSRIVDSKFIAKKQSKYPYRLEVKEYFKIIDMGGNAKVHGDWSADRDWSDLFHNPQKPKDTLGVAPVRSCEECEAIVPAQQYICMYCGFEKERKPDVYDTIAVEFELIVSKINVAEINRKSINKGYQDYAPFFAILGQFITTLKYKFSFMEMSEDVRINTFAQFEIKVKEWRRLNDKTYNKHIQKFAREKFDAAFDKLAKKLEAA